MKNLLDIRMHDGSRKFAALPASKDWYSVRDHVERLEGAQLVGFLCDDVIEAWIDFVYEGQSFTINDQFGEYGFFASDSACCDKLLYAVEAHWANLLDR